MNNHRSSRQGFTLVELSIVLVVIGLLIGGVLVGKSLVEGAKINAQVKQFQQFDIAVSNFRGKFGGLPGDIGNLPNGSTPNRDGYIGYQGGFGFPVYTQSQEWANFWRQLTISKMLSSKMVYSNNTNPITAGTSTPISALNPNAGVAAFGEAGLGKNYYEIFVYPNNWTYYAHGANTPKSLKVMQAAALDSKMDDGNGGTGIITSIKPINLSSFIANIDTSSTCLLSDNSYNASTGSGVNTCILRIEMLSSSGIKQ